MDTKIHNKKTIVVSVILTLIVGFVVLTSNYWFLGIVSLFAPDSSHKLQPLMEQYLEQKYGNEMKLDRVGRPGIGMGTKIYGTAHRINMSYISFNINYEKNKAGSYEFSDDYYKQYLKYLIENRLNEISKQIYKIDFKSGELEIFSIKENDLPKIESFGIDVSLDECMDIVNYTFDYGVHYNGNFEESKIELMYDILKNIYESGVIPNYIWYSFESSSFSYTLSDSDKNGTLISYYDFKEELLAQYNK